MDVATWILVGLIIGALARSFMPGRDRIGSIATIAVGIFGAVVGGRLWALLFDRYEGFAWVAWTRSSSHCPGRKIAASLSWLGGLP
jgi:uncharacterized membrane protein YeaQ/YmgE (transglycosylase-associated protein family)